MPTIFLDFDLLLELVDIYDPPSHEIRDIHGGVLMKINADLIRESFGLFPAKEVTDVIDSQMFEEAFDRAWKDAQNNMIISFLK